MIYDIPAHLTQGDMIPYGKELNNMKNIDKSSLAIEL